MGPSPTWMQQRLVKAGVRLDQQRGRRHQLRAARAQPAAARLRPRPPRRPGDRGAASPTDGERDHHARRRRPRRSTRRDLLICDGDRAPQAIAGIMGGGDSEVSDATSRILLESAYFERMGIARSSKRLQAPLRVERALRARHRPRRRRPGRGRARWSCCVEVAGARVATDAGRRVPAPGRAPAHPPAHEQGQRRARDRAHRHARCSTRSRPLGIDVAGSGDEIEAVPPTFRPDLEREIDLVEEVARRVGFDAIGRTVPKPEHQVGGLSHRQRTGGWSPTRSWALGLSEAVTIPLVSPEAAARFQRRDARSQVANPLRSEESVLRPSLLAGPADRRRPQRHAGSGRRRAVRAGSGVPRRPTRAGSLPGRARVGRRASLVGTVRRSAGRGRPPGRRLRRGRCRARGRRHARDRRRADRARRGCPASTRARRRGAGRGSGGRVRSGRSHRRCSPPRRSRGRPSASSSTSTPSTLPRRGRPPVPARRRRTRRRRSTSPSWSTTTCRPPTVAATLRDGGRRPRSRTSAASTSSGASSSAPGRRSLAFALRFRAPDRTLTDAEVLELPVRMPSPRSRLRHGAELRG